MFDLAALDESYNQYDGPDKRAWLEDHYDNMPDYLKFWYSVRVYQEDGYNFPHSRIIQLKKLKPDDYLMNLDSSFDDVDEITVYRGEGNDFKPETKLSWSTDKNVAIWFYQRRKNRFDGLSNDFPLPKLYKIGCSSPVLYKATINKKRIIATLPGPEHEILQHMGVYNVQKLFPTEEEIQEAVFQHKKAVEKEELQNVSQHLKPTIKIVQQDDGDYMIVDSGGIVSSGLCLDDMLETLNKLGLLGNTALQQEGQKEKPPEGT